MGYTTDFSGSVTVTPPLNEAEVAYLNKFAATRRMRRKQGPYCVEDERKADIVDYNTPPEGQPGLWCQWVSTEDGTEITWDGGEKFYNAPEWMEYIIDHFLAPGAKAAEQLPFLQANHIVNGTIEAQGEDGDDRWRLVATNNVVAVNAGRVVYED